MSKLTSILPQPKLRFKEEGIYKWLAGEGAGSWFKFKTTIHGGIEIHRYSPEGELECFGVFVTTKKIELNNKFDILYPSHCALVTLKQKNDICIVTRLKSK